MKIIRVGSNVSGKLMGDLFKLVRDELFKPKLEAQGFKVDNQRKAFAVTPQRIELVTLSDLQYPARTHARTHALYMPPALIFTDFGTDPLTKALEKSFESVPLMSENEKGFHTLAGRKSGKRLTYEHLHSLPCVLLLMDKGRMRDTFPHSFDCLDLRICTSDNVSTLIQELGRLCRYPVACSSQLYQLPAEPAERQQLFTDGCTMIAVEKLSDLSVKHCEYITISSVMLKTLTAWNELLRICHLNLLTGAFSTTCRTR
eukprot:6417268-Prymnesium_polylepis.2